MQTSDTNNDNQQGRVLIQRLTGVESPVLTDRDVAFIGSLFEQIARDQLIIIGIERTLSRYVDAESEMDAILTEASGLIGHHITKMPQIDNIFDVNVARSARIELARSIQNAKDQQAIWSAAAKFVIQIIRIII